MKILLNLIIIALLISCRGTKFTYATDKFVNDNLVILKPISIDNTYELYERQVVKVKDPITQQYIPQNGEVTKDHELIEIEYLFISQKYKRIIIINNIPNKFRKFYNSGDKYLDLNANAKEQKIDIWYFRQFRIGELSSDGSFLFPNIEWDKKISHKWIVDRSKGNDTIVIKALSIIDDFGEETTNLKSAFSLQMQFVKVDNFKLVFKNNAGKTLNTKSVPEFDLPGNTFYLSQNEGDQSILFRFNTQINNQFSNILFHKERIYSMPGNLMP